MDVSDVTADVTASSEAKTPEASTDSAKIPEIPEPVATTSATAVAAPSTVVKPHPDLSIDLLGAANTSTSAPAVKKEPKKRKSDEHGHHVVKKFKNNSMDKIVSPVVPQPGAWLKRSNSVNKWAKPRQVKPQDKDATLPAFKEKDKLFQYGNYNR